MEISDTYIYSHLSNSRGGCTSCKINKRGGGNKRGGWIFFVNSINEEGEKSKRARSLESGIHLNQKNVNVEVRINEEVGKKSKKSINEEGGIFAKRVDFFFKINKRVSSFTREMSARPTFIQYTSHTLDTGYTIIYTYIDKSCLLARYQLTWVHCKHKISMK